MSIFQRDPVTTTDPPSPMDGRRTAALGASKIAPGNQLQGNLSGTSDVIVEGRVEGKVTVEGTVAVAAGGEVHGLVEARVVRVAGKVVGNLVASDLVELAATAVLEGDIQATRVVIAEGAFFTGKVAMASPAAKSAPKPGKPGS